MSISMKALAFLLLLFPLGCSFRCAFLTYFSCHANSDRQGNRFLPTHRHLHLVLSVPFTFPFYCASSRLGPFLSIGRWHFRRTNAKADDATATTATIAVILAGRYLWKQATANPERLGPLCLLPCFNFVWSQQEQVEASWLDDKTEEPLYDLGIC